MNFKAAYDQWMQKFGEEKAKFLFEEMSRWTEAYSHGTLIDYDFLKPLNLPDQVRQVCLEKGWEYDQLQGDLGLFQRLIDGDWLESDFLVVQPGQKVVPSFDEKVIGAG